MTSKKGWRNSYFKSSAICVLLNGRKWKYILLTTTLWRSQWKMLISTIFHLFYQFICFVLSLPLTLFCFFLGMWCYLHLFLSINGRRIELVEIYHKNYWGDIYIDMIFSLTHNYAVTIWRWSTLCGVTKKIYIIADIILSFQYMIYTEDKDSSTYTRFWLSKKRKKSFNALTNYYTNPLWLSVSCT